MIIIFYSGIFIAWEVRKQKPQLIIWLFQWVWLSFPPFLLFGMASMEILVK